MKKTKKSTRTRVIRSDSRFLQDLEAIWLMVPAWGNVADSLRVSRQTCWRWRSGKARPFSHDRERARLLVRLARNQREIFEYGDLDLEDLREAAQEM
jgi:hypothetical protein